MTDTPLENLARRIAQTRSIDRAGKQALARELKSLRGRLYPSAGQDLVDRVEAAVLLMHFIATQEDAPGDGLQLVARLTAAFDERCFAPPPPEPESAKLPAGLEGLATTSKLGDVMVHIGMITAEQLDEALRVKRNMRLPLGVCLERLGHATSGQVARALELQKRLRAVAEPAPQAAPPAPLPSVRRSELKLEVRDGSAVPTLAELLVQSNQLSPQQLERASVLQRAAGVHFEEALIQLGFLSLDQIKQAKQVQERLRK
jgi:hypothetical protein